MYEEYFGLVARPFQLSPDARYFYNSKQHSRALAHLTYGLAQGEGFVVITGEIGAGKTTLMEHLVSNLDPSRYVVAQIATTNLAPTGFLRSVLDALQIPKRAADKSKMLSQFQEFLRNISERNRRILLIVDEVQNLPWGSLEELRMLSNLKGGTASALQTCLVGQPQFREVLADAKAEQLKQRVVTAYHLGALLEDEVSGYVHHRLSLAGWSGRPRFSDEVFTAIYAHCGGIPRRLNLVCDRLLLEAYLEGLPEVTVPVANRVIQELQDEESGWRAADKQRSDPDSVSSDGVAQVEARIGALERGAERQFGIVRAILGALEHYAAKGLA